VSLGQGAEHGYRLAKSIIYRKWAKGCRQSRHWASDIWSSLFSSQAACSKSRASDPSI